MRSGSIYQVLQVPTVAALRGSMGMTCITSGDALRKTFCAQTDRNLSFEAVGSSFEYRIGQKVGMAVYHNCAFDFSNDNVYTHNGWDKNQLSQSNIFRLCGNDYSVSIYTGEITAVSTDQKAFQHDINTFTGCSGAIVFLLDKNQDGLVGEHQSGKAIGIHAGALEEIATGEDGSQSSVAKFNFAFALAGFVKQTSATLCKKQQQQAGKLVD